MTRFREFLERARPMLKRGVLSHTLETLRLDQVGQVSRRAVNGLDARPAVAEWIGTPRRTRAPMGAAFGNPTNATSRGVFWKRMTRPTDADTRPNRQSLIPSRDATAPNPGRHRFGGGQREF